MAPGRRARARGRSGSRGRVRLQPQTLAWDIRQRTVTESQMATRLSVQGLTSAFHGSSFTDPQQRAALEAYFGFTQVRNQRGTYYVTFNQTSGTTTILVFNIVGNSNTSTLDVAKVGTPTSTLPNASAVQTIERRLTQNSISFIGRWSNNDKRIMLAGINCLSNRELGKMTNLRISRLSSPSGTATEDSRTIGACYLQQHHKIEVYDSALTNGALMALGTSANSLLPAGAHNILHEAGHVLAYAEIRQARERDQQAQRDFDAARAAMRSRWSPQYYRETGSGASLRYFCEHHSRVPSERRSTYQADVRNLERTRTARQTANQTYVQLTHSQVMTRFETIARNLTPVTPYSQRIAQHAVQTGNADDRWIALEEFLAESFAIYRWDSAWLQTNRPTIHRFFTQNRHA